MKISVIDVPSLWVLDGDNFYCCHEEMRVETLTQDHFGSDGHYQTESDWYVCVDCLEVLGIVQEDYADDYESLREY